MLGIELFVFGLFLFAFLAGLLGSLIGLGGGILIVPLLTLVFRLDIHLAVGASIVSIIATSSGAAAAYVRDHLTHVRAGIFLELATSSGAVLGALLVPFVPGRALYFLFAGFLLLSLGPMARRLGEEIPTGVQPDWFARHLRLGSAYPDRALGRVVRYEVTRVPIGFAMMFVAGLASALLGLGAGALKVLAMDWGMRMPMKVSTATSNFMIGVTAAASAGIYFWRGDVVPLIATPVMLGVLAGSLVGAQLLLRMTNRRVRQLFIPILLVIAFQMFLRGLGVW
ncbi:sulfite exporter TauE/SafE family protein [Thermomicrobium sp. 4228-Ro]|uniref:sulfite exporter TauE/SafE family protein n=1 Tax=Thermomicrobium sp. 4228-Ro TaxID=2993937 RepID=UPI0022495205|nr:sulfite exporter TauE/SafE family protein [Thermomicrobium sp. 4228-Ro]MCX2726561.1 sulfite exporter TauE/SafE family protein [Thermomicrobium sp. 4228-Ro]